MCLRTGEKSTCHLQPVGHREDKYTQGSQLAYLTLIFVAWGIVSHQHLAIHMIFRACVRFIPGEWLAQQHKNRVRTDCEKSSRRYKSESNLVSSRIDTSSLKFYDCTESRLKLLLYQAATGWGMTACLPLHSVSVRLLFQHYLFKPSSQLQEQCENPWKRTVRESE